jgi:pimeloyl-ACP methyl ester carboxylesterase
MKKLWWSAGVLTALAVIAGVGFWLRPVCYFNEATYLHERFSGVENRTVEVAGHRVHYLAEGPAAGPVVVLVHGLGGRAEDWDKLAASFATAGFRVYRPDLPGYGRSEKPADFSYSVRDQAGVVVGFMDALGLKQVDLGGWSMGGWIVQIMAGAHPERIKHLMIFDSVGIYERPTWNTQLFTPATESDLKQLNELLTPRPRAIPGFVAQDILRLSRENGWVIQRAVGTMMTGQDTTDGLLPGLKMPVLIAWGAEDKLVSTGQAEKMHRLIPHSTLDVFAGCGHLAPSQCAQQMAPKLLEFVKQ